MYVFSTTEDSSPSKINDKSSGNAKNISNRKLETAKSKTGLKDITEVEMDLNIRDNNDIEICKTTLKNIKNPKDQRRLSKNELWEANNVEVDLKTKQPNGKNSSKRRRFINSNKKFPPERKQSETELVEAFGIDIDLFAQENDTVSSQKQHNSKEDEEKHKTQLKEEQEIEMDLYSKEISHSFVDTRRPSLLRGLPSFNGSSPWLFARISNVTLPAGRRSIQS